MTCDQVRTALTEEAGDRPGTTAAHLASCIECHKFASGLDAGVAWVRTPPATPFPASLSTRVLAAVRRTSPPVVRPAPGLRLAAACAVVLALVFALWFDRAERVFAPLPLRVATRTSDVFAGATASRADREMPAGSFGMAPETPILELPELARVDSGRRPQTPMRSERDPEQSIELALRSVPGAVPEAPRPDRIGAAKDATSGQPAQGRIGAAGIVPSAGARGLETAKRDGVASIQVLRSRFRPDEGESAGIVVVLPESLHLRVEVFDGTGTLVARLIDTMAAEARLSWDGRGSAGRCASGVYHVLVSTPRGVQRRDLVLER